MIFFLIEANKISRITRRVTPLLEEFRRRLRCREIKIRIHLPTLKPLICKCYSNKKWARQQTMSQ